MRFFKYVILPLCILIASFYLIPALSVLIACAVVIVIFIYAIGAGSSWYENYERRYRDGMEEQRNTKREHNSDKY